MVAAVEASGEYRVVRRLVTPDPLPCPPGAARLGLVIDVETTGADLRGDEVIELAMVRFAYTPEGEVLSVVDTFQGYHEPNRTISAEITALTGISADTVAGHARSAPLSRRRWSCWPTTPLSTGASPSGSTPTSPPRPGAAP